MLKSAGRAFELRLYYYQRGGLAARSLGFYYLPNESDKLNLIRMVDLPEGSTGYRVVFDPVQFPIGSYHYVRGENIGQIKVHSLAIDKTDLTFKGLANPVAADWQQVYPN